MQARVVYESNSITNSGKVIHSHKTTDTKQISRIVSDTETAFSRTDFYYDRNI